MAVYRSNWMHCLQKAQCIRLIGLKERGHLPEMSCVGLPSFTNRSFSKVNVPLCCALTSKSTRHPRRTAIARCPFIARPLLRVPSLCLTTRPWQHPPWPRSLSVYFIFLLGTWVTTALFRHHKAVICLTIAAAVVNWACCVQTGDASRWWLGIGVQHPWASLPALWHCRSNFLFVSRMSQWLLDQMLRNRALVNRRELQQRC